MNTTHIDFLNYDTEFSIVTIDASVYNPDVDIVQPSVDITAPNFSCGSKFTYTPNGVFNMNSYILGWSSQDCLSSLPDGLWIYRMSTCPNDQLVKVKNYLRIYSTKNSILNRVLMLRDKLNEQEATQYLVMLQDLEVAKYMVEYLCEVEKGVILFNSICSQIQKGCTHC